MMRVLHCYCYDISVSFVNQTHNVVESLLIICCNLIHLQVTLSCINLAEGLLSLGRGAKVSSKMPSQEEMNSAEEMERQRNDANQTSV